MEKTPAVITPLDEHMGLDIARSLGRRGIPVYGFDWDSKAVGRKSKYCRLVVCPDPSKAEAEYVQCVLDWGKRMRRRVVLYPLRDDLVLLWSRERERLQQYYEYVMPDHATMVRLTSKDGLVAAARECGVPAPETVVPDNSEEVEAFARTLSYPVILKPSQSVYWQTPEMVSFLREGLLSARTKVKLCQNPAELIHSYRRIAQYDDRLVIQEVITGPATNLDYISFYLDRQSRPLGMFAGHKMRILPSGFGSASYVRSFYDRELEEVALRLLSGVRYQGLGGLEFKKDPRDGRYKVIEFNTRYGMWDGLGIRCGIDNAYAAYRDALGLPVETQSTYREDVTWLDWSRDLRAFWGLHKQERITLGEWLRSLRGEKMWAIYSMDDWRPGVAFTFHLLYLLWERIRGRSPALSFPTRLKYIDRLSKGVS